MLAVCIVLLAAGTLGCELPTSSDRPSPSLIDLPFTPIPSASASSSEAPPSAEPTEAAWPPGWNTAFCTAFADATVAHQLVIDVERAIQDSAPEDARALSHELTQTASLAGDEVDGLRTWDPAADVKADLAALLVLDAQVGGSYSAYFKDAHKSDLKAARQTRKQVRKAVAPANEHLAALTEMVSAVPAPASSWRRSRRGRASMTDSAAVSGTTTFLFTDIEGSTKLLQRLGAPYAMLLDEHRRLIGEAVERAGGRVFGTEGDAVFSAFPTAAGALDAAVEALRALEAHAWPDAGAVRVRIGIHSGEALLTGGDYVGMAVHQVARIMSAGHGGQALVSEAARQLVPTLPAGIELRDLGTHRLKDLAAPERLYQIVASGLEEHFPALRTLDARPNNLPVQMTSFVGRAELAAAREGFAETHLLTLTGPGGTGKTRLALQLAGDVSDEFDGGLFRRPRFNQRCGPCRAGDCLGSGRRAGRRGRRRSTQSSSTCANASCCSCSTTSSRSSAPPKRSRGCSGRRPGQGHCHHAHRAARVWRARVSGSAAGHAAGRRRPSRRRDGAQL